MEDLRNWIVECGEAAVLQVVRGEVSIGDLALRYNQSATRARWEVGPNYPKGFGASRLNGLARRVYERRHPETEDDDDATYHCAVERRLDAHFERRRAAKGR